MISIQPVLVSQRNQSLIIIYPIGLDEFLEENGPHAAGRHFDDAILTVEFPLRNQCRSAKSRLTVGLDARSFQKPGDPQ